MLIAPLAAAGCTREAPLELPPPSDASEAAGAAADGSETVPTAGVPLPGSSPLGALGGLAGAGGASPLRRALGQPQELGSLPLDALVRECQANGRSGRYRIPATDETERLEAIARAVLAHARGAGDSSPSLEELDRSAQMLGFRLARASAGRARFLALAEVAGLNRGGGIYVFRETVDPAPFVIQAPHCFFDLHTGEIARTLFVETRAACLMLNTVHRRSRAENPARARGVTHPADLAHVEPSHFQAVTEAASKAIAGAVFVQVHGFAADASDARSVAPPDDAAAIASKGEAWSLEDALFDRFVAEVGSALAGHGRVLVYPHDTRLLGATTNVQGRYLNGYSDDLFYHLELCAGVREELAAGGASLRALAGAFRVLEAGAPVER